MLTKMNPLSVEEEKLLIADGFDLKQIRGVDDLVTSDTCFFAATGVTKGDILHGVEYKDNYAVTTSMCTRGRTGTVRYIEAWHDRKKLASMSSVRY